MTLLRSLPCIQTRGARDLPSGVCIRQHPQSCTCLFVSNTALLSTSFSPPFLSQAPATGLSSHARSFAMNDPAVTIASLGAYSNSHQPNLANDGSIQDVWPPNEHLPQRPNERSSCRPLWCLPSECTSATTPCQTTTLTRKMLVRTLKASLLSLRAADGWVWW